MSIKILNKNIFFLSGTKKRFKHLASVQMGVREFMCFFDVLTSKVYIEEISGGHLEFIEDDKLAKELAVFMDEHGLTEISRVFDEASFKI
jgi:hypothetical protein